MKPLASAIIFVACLGWIAASIVLTGHIGREFSSWDWLAALGAAFSFLSVVD